MINAMGDQKYLTTGRHRGERSITVGMDKGSTGNTDAEQIVTFTGE